MDSSIILLSVTAISITFIHTILGPDHYLHFIVLSQTKNWKLRKTMIISIRNLIKKMKHSQLIAGAMIFLSGFAIQFLGL